MVHRHKRQNGLCVLAAISKIASSIFFVFAILNHKNIPKANFEVRICWTIFPSELPLPTWVYGIVASSLFIRVGNSNKEKKFELCRRKLIITWSIHGMIKNNPGPTVPFFWTRPNLKSTARSYSWTIRMQNNIDTGNVHTIIKMDKIHKIAPKHDPMH